MSRSVDERVVEMRFDNKQFEQGVSQTLESLDKLNNALEFKNVKNSAKELEKISDATQNVDFSKMSTQLDFLEKRLSTLGIVGMTVIQDLTRSVLNFGKNVWNNTIGQIKSGGMARAMNIENAKFQLEGLHVAWNTVADDIDYAVSGTAYGLDAAAKACAQLTASGVQAGEDMKKALRAISGVAAMTNTSYEEIAPIFTTVAGQGKVMTMQLRQLESRGLNAAASIGEALGKSEAEIRDMVTKGKIDFNTFAAAMDDAFGEHAKDANKTFSGALSNMKAALSRIGADFATPYMNMMIKVYNGLRVVFNGIRKELQPVVKFATKAMEAIGNASEKMFGSTKMQLLYISVITNLRNVFNALLTVLIPVGRAFKAVFPEGLLGTIADFNAHLVRLTSKLGLTYKGMSVLQKIFEVFFTVLKSAATIISKLVGTILPPVLKIVLLIGKAIGSVVGLITNIVSAITGATGELKIVDILLTGISKALNVVVNVVALAVAGFTALVNVLQRINLFKGISTIFQAITSAMGFLVANIGTFVSNFMQLEIVQKILTGIIVALYTITKVLSTTIQLVILTVNSLIQYLTQLWNKLEVGTKIANVFSNIGKIFKTIGAEFIHIVNELKSGKGIFEILRDEVNKLISAIDGLGQKIKDNIINLYNSDKFTWLRDIVARLKAIIPPAEEAHGWLKKILDFLSQNMNKIIAVGYLALVTTLTLSFKRFIDTARGLASAATSLIGNINGIFKPIVQQRSKIQQVGDLFVKVAGSIAVLALINRKYNGDLREVADILINLMNALTAIVVVMTGLDMLAKATKLAGGIETASKALMSISLGVAALSASLFILEKLDFNTSIKNLVVVAGLLAELAVAAKFLSTMKNAPQGALAIAALAGSVYVIISALAKLESFDTENLAQDIVALAAIIGALTVATRAAGKIKLTSAIALMIFVNQFDKILPVAKRIAEELKPLAVSLIEGFKKWFAGVSEAIANSVSIKGQVEYFKQNWQWVAGMAGIVAAVAISLGASFKMAANGLKTMSKSLILIAAAFAFMGQIARQLGVLPEKQLKKGVQVLAAFSIMVAAMEALSALTKESKMLKFSASMVIMTGVFAIMFQLCKTIGKFPDQAAIWKGVFVLGALSAMVALLEGMSALTSKAKVMPILALCTTLVALATELVVLSFVKWDDLKGPIQAMAVVMGGLAVVLAAVSALNRTSKDSKGVIGKLLVVGALLGELSYALYKLVQLGGDWRQIAAVSAGMSAAMISFGILLKTIASIGDVSWGEKKFKNLVAGAIGLAEVAAALYLLSKYGGDADKMMAAGMGIALAMPGFASALSIIGSAKGNWAQNKTKNVAAAMVGLFGVTIAMQNIAMVHADWKELVAAGAGLGIALNGFAGAIVIMTKLGSTSAKTMTLVPAIVGTALAAVPLAYALSMLASYDWSGELLQTCVGMSAVLLAFSVAVGILAKMAQGGTGWSAVNLAVMAVDMIALAAALAIVTPAIQQLAQLSWADLLPAAAVLAAIAGSVKLFEVIGKAGLEALPYVAIGIGVIAAAILGLEFVADIAQKFANVLDTLMTSVINFANGFQQLHGEDIKNNFIAIAEGMEEMTAPIWNLVGALAVITITGIPAILALSIAVKALGTYLPGIAGSLDEFAASFDKIKNLDFSNLVTQIQNMSDAFIDFVKVAIEIKVLSNMADVLTDFANSLDRIGDNVTVIHAMTEELQGFAEALKNTSADVETYGSTITDYIQNEFATNLYDQMYDAGLSAGDGLVDGVQASGNLANVKNAFELLANTATSSFAKKVGYNSPWEWMVTAAKWACKGLAKVTDGMPTVSAAFSLLGGGAAEAASTTLQNGINSAVPTIVESFTTKLVDGVGGALSEVNNLVSGFDFSNPANLLNSMFGETDLPDWLTGNGENPIENALNEISNAAGGAGGAAKKLSKEDEELEKAERSLSITTQVLAEKFKHMYTDDFLTKIASNGHRALEQLGMDITRFGKMYENITSKVESSLSNIFDEVSEVDYFDKEDILYNMQDHLDMITDWMNDMEYLGSKVGTEISTALYEKLANMGPEGAKYIKAFTEMTDDELKHASNLYDQALTMPDYVASNISASFLNAGMQAIAGLENGLRDTSKSDEAAAAAGDSATNAIMSALGEHSPSTVFADVGMNAILGLSNGIETFTPVATLSLERAAVQMVTTFRNRFLNGNPNPATIAKEFIAKLAAGMVLDAATVDKLVNPIVSGIIRSLNTKAEQLRQNGSFICKELVAGFNNEMKNQYDNIAKGIDQMYKYIIDAFQSAKNQAKVEKLCRWFVDGFVKELIKKETTQKKILKYVDELIEVLEEPLQEKLEEWGTTAGKFFGAGFIAGMEESEEDVYKGAYKMGEKALEGLEAALEEESPSKRGYKDGVYLGVGTANGITDSTDQVEHAARRMGTGAVNALEKTLGESNQIGKKLAGRVRKTVSAAVEPITEAVYKAGEGANATLIKEVDKMAGVLNNMAPKVNKALQKVKTVSAKKAKEIAATLNQPAIYKAGENMAKAFVPVQLMVNETDECVKEGVQKVVFRVGNGVKDVNKHINNAIKFVKNLDTTMMNHRGIDSLVGSLQNINKYFAKLKSGKAPEKVIKFLDNLRTEMKPVNDLVDKMCKKFYNVNDALKKHTKASNDARIGLIRFGEKIFSTTEAGKEYNDLQEKIKKAEEELEEARAEFAKKQEEREAQGARTRKARKEAAEQEAEDLQAVTEKEEALAELRAQEIPYVQALAKAVDEYRQNLNEAYKAQMDVYNALDKTSGALDPSKLVGNTMSWSINWKNFKKGITSLADKNLGYDLIKALGEGGLESIGKISSWDKLDKRTIMLINDIIEKNEKKAKNAANVAVSAIAQSLTDKTLKEQKKFKKTMNEGDKAFKKILKGQVEYFGQTVSQFGVGSKQVETLLTHMRGAFADLEDEINLAGETFHGVQDVFHKTDDVATDLFGSVEKLCDVFEINAEKAGNAGEMIAQMTEKLNEYGESVKGALQLSNPFDKYEATEGITKDQLLFNVNSMRQAQIEYEQVMNQLVGKVAPEILAKLETMGLSEGLAYGRALLEATDAELGYFNEVVVQNLKFAADQEEKAKARMIENCRPLMEGIRKGLKEAFDKEGVQIPLTDPSKISEEDTQGAYDTGETIAESVEEGEDDELEDQEEEVICLIDGLDGSVRNNSAQLVTVGKKAGKKFVKGEKQAIEDSDLGDTIASTIDKSVSKGVEKGTSTAVTAATKSATTTVTKFGTDSEKLLTENFKKAAEATVKNFQDAINKINQMIAGINTNIVISVQADMSQAQAALDAFNNAKSVSLNTASYAGTSVSNSTPSIGWEINGEKSGSAGETTNVIFNQYNTSPKALDAVENYRYGEKLANQIDSRVKKVGKA